MKKVLYVILALVVIYLLLCLFGPKQIRVERSVVVNAPAENVKTQLTDLKFFQEKWSPWSEMDPNMKTNFEGSAGQVGHKYSWEGNKDVGKGTLEIKKIEGDSLIENLHFDDMGDSKIYFVTKPEATGSNVMWGILIDISFFGRGPMLFMNMDKMMGADFERGLSKFKTVMESMPVAAKYKGFDIKETEWDEKTFFGKRTVLGWDKMEAFFGEVYPKLFADLGKMKVEPLMAPSTIFFTWDEVKKESDFAAVVNVAKGTELKGWEKFTLEPSKVLVIDYYGDYNKIGDAHMGMAEYIKEKGLGTESYVLDEYVTDPGAEKDTSKWLTKVYYLFKK